MYTRIPYWFWVLHVTPLRAWWLLPVMAAVTAFLYHCILTRPWSVAGKIALLMFCGTLLQFGFAFAEGRGIDGLRDRIVKSGHAEFALTAVLTYPCLGFVITHYDELTMGGGLGKYTPSKPPGQLLCYTGTLLLADALLHPTLAKAQLHASPERSSKPCGVHNCRRCG